MTEWLSGCAAGSVIKAEVRLSRPRAAGVTNLRQTPRFIYEKVYVLAGTSRIGKELLDGLQIDRKLLSVLGEPVARLPTAAAYVLMQEDCGRRVLRVAAR